MKKLTIVFLLCLLQAPFTHACLNTYQFKIFPIGHLADEIVSVDVQIRRTSQFEGNRGLKLGRDELNNPGPMWILVAHISRYDFSQSLLATTTLDTLYAVGDHYLDTLNNIYQNSLDEIKSQYPQITLFQPDCISFCDWQRNCKLVQAHYDSLKSQNFLIYEGTPYQIDILGEHSYYGFGKSPYHTNVITRQHINSIRVYKSAKVEIVLAHWASGHEIGMGLDNRYPSLVDSTSFPPITLSEEYTPEFRFDDLKSCTYEEPLLHHGYGVDLFLVTRPHGIP